MSDDTAILTAFICLLIDAVLLIYLTSGPTTEQLMNHYEEYEDGNTNNF